MQCDAAVPHLRASRQQQCHALGSAAAAHRPLLPPPLTLLAAWRLVVAPGPHSDVVHTCRVWCWRALALFPVDHRCHAHMPRAVSKDKLRRGRGRDTEREGKCERGGQKNKRVGQTSEGRMAGNLGLDRRDALSRRHIHSDVSLHSAETVAQQAVPRRPATEQSYSEAPHTRGRRGRRAWVGGVLRSAERRAVLTLPLLLPRVGFAPSHRAEEGHRLALSPGHAPVAARGSETPPLRRRRCVGTDLWSVVSGAEPERL